MTTPASPSTELVSQLATTPDTLDLFESFLTPDPTQTEAEQLNLAVAQVPSLFGVSDMATYLGYRAMGLTTQQALLIMNADEDLLDFWKRNSPKLLDFEAKALPLLQRYAAKEAIRLAFTRNMALFMAKDQQVIQKAMVVGLDTLSNREFAWLRSIRKHYTNADLLAIEKTINPESFHGDTIIHLDWGSPAQILEGVQVPYGLSDSSD